MNTRDHTAMEDFEGLAIRELLPLEWEPSPLDDPTVLEHCGQDTARALQALAIFDEAPREPSADAAHHPAQDRAHLELKVDVLLSLVARLVADRDTLPPRHVTVLRPDSIEWTGPAGDTIVAGDGGIVTLYPSARMPLSFRLPVRVERIEARDGRRRVIARFEGLSSPARVGIEKLLFRHHRRQVAFARGTDVFSRTGVFSQFAAGRPPKS